MSHTTTRSFITLNSGTVDCNLSSSIDPARPPAVNIHSAAENSPQQIQCLLQYD